MNEQPQQPSTIVDHTAAASPGSAEGSRSSSRMSILWREWCRPLLIIGVVMFSFRSAVADWNDVPTGSMKPTILEGDRIFINKVAYDLKFPFTTWRLAEWGQPKWGDVVVLRSPDDGRRLVKRVVGLPGDEIRILNNRLYVNGQQAHYEPIDPVIYEQLDIEQPRGHVVSIEEVAGREHPIMISSSRSSSGPWVMPGGKFFVMGDNRDNSRDSRIFGPVDRAAILGRATAVALSVDPDNYYMPRWKRFFTPLL